MPTQVTRKPSSAKPEGRNIRVRKSPKAVRALLWFEKSGKSVLTCTLNYDGGRGKIRTYHVGSEDGRLMALRPLEIWSERQLMLLICRATCAGREGEHALVPVELMQRVLGYRPNEFADPV